MSRQQHKVANLFPGAVAPDHVLDTRIVVEPMDAMRDTHFFIQGTHSTVTLPNLFVILPNNAILAVAYSIIIGHLKISLAKLVGHGPQPARQCPIGVLIGMSLAFLDFVLFDWAKHLMLACICWSSSPFAINVRCKN